MVGDDRSRSLGGDAARNAAASIEEAIRSALDQTAAGADRRVDDGSDDDTATIAAGLDERRVVHRHEHRGIGASRDAGLALADTDLIAFLDATTCGLPRKLELQLAALAEHPQFDAGVLPVRRVPRRRHPRGRRRQTTAAWPGGPVGVRALLRRSVIERVGPFTASPLGDWVRWWRPAIGIAEHIVPEVLWRRRIHGLNNSHARADDGRTYLALVRAHRREVIAARRGGEEPPT